MGLQKIGGQCPSCILMAIFLVCGCHTAKVAQPLTGKLGGNDPDSQLEFWHTLATRPVTSNEEAFHGMLLYANSDARWGRAGGEKITKPQINADQKQKTSHRWGTDAHRWRRTRLSCTLAFAPSCNGCGLGQTS